MCAEQGDHALAVGTAVGNRRDQLARGSKGRRRDERARQRGRAPPRDTGKVPAFPGMVEWMYTLCFVPYHDQ